MLCYLKYDKIGVKLLHLRSRVINTDKNGMPSFKENSVTYVRMRIIFLGTVFVLSLTE
jgi:hypothetical protein